jgi:hypothetical protein
VAAWTWGPAWGHESMGTPPCDGVWPPGAPVRAWAPHHATGCGPPGRPGCADLPAAEPGLRAVHGSPTAPTACCGARACRAARCRRPVCPRPGGACERRRRPSAMPCAARGRRAGARRAASPLISPRPALPRPLRPVSRAPLSPPAHAPPSPPDRCPHTTLPARAGRQQPCRSPARTPPRSSGSLGQPARWCSAVSAGGGRPEPRARAPGPRCPAGRRRTARGCDQGAHMARRGGGRPDSGSPHPGPRPRPAPQAWAPPTAPPSRAWASRPWA